ncbi:Xaa-Pro aminopeptidase [Vagococcus penaei]|uniref:Xaa-Pro aminopeptidase n=1 Tax=Vagococcus penaei TaxID=633807 RepID=A0A1Q2D5P9_9ENTE|nr:M24 family metallopeptidase [Vagococcus penaei]AQP53567.1 Xaa-Pro aminopeptidase [Vagococcus penaei]RSU07511.1 Xaa-Pro aminopeptidase [Vagococcus penaei]
MQHYLKKVKSPKGTTITEKVFLTDETLQARKEKLLSLMKEYNFSSLIIYADKEHGASFEYLTGFIPRFEEGIQLLKQDGTSTLLLGNENYNKVPRARTQSDGILCPLLSLPNQPMDLKKSMGDYFKQAVIDTSSKVGLVGWKLLTTDITDERQLFDVPAFIVEGLQAAIGQDVKLVNATHLLIGPEIGVRTVNNANELAHYEYGASLASDSVLDAMNHLKEGISEREVGECLTKEGQYNTVISIAAFGERFEKANLYPTNRVLNQGDKVSLTVAYKGGLSSRNGYAVSTYEQLEDIDPGYFLDVVIPYYRAYRYWLDQIKIGKTGGAFYREFSNFYPQEIYGWGLCPGHLVADEEWLSSPFYEGSKAELRSGMLFQVDFIPIQKGHQGVSAESTVAIADARLRSDIEINYPEMWQRIVERRRYLSEELNIHLHEELLPMCDTLGYLRPLLLNSDIALVLE